MVDLLPLAFAIASVALLWGGDHPFYPPLPEPPR